MLIICGAQVYTPAQVLENRAVRVVDGMIEAVAPANVVAAPDGAQVVDATGLLLVPGLVDLQVNGGFGLDFTHDPTTIWTVAQSLPCFGVTGFLPTIITSPVETVDHAQRVLQEGPPRPIHGARVLGLHIEGPFLNRERRGAHPADFLRRPDETDVPTWTVTEGVRLVTLAPELSGALRLARSLSRAGVVVSAGHSHASYDQTVAGIAAGIRYGTHIFNGMAPFHHREPGVAGALLADPRVVVGLIPDGIHVHPAAVRLIWQLVGPERLNLVSDAMAALGMPPGRYQLGDQVVSVRDEIARLTDGTLAGSVVTPNAALRNLIRFTGCKLREALPSLTTVPAHVLGLEHRRGRIATGYDADMVLMTPEFEVAATIVAGEIVYQNPAHPLARMDPAGSETTLSAT